MAKTNLGGLTPVRLKGGAPNSGGLEQYNIASGYAANLFTGTPVKLNASGFVEVADTSNRVLGTCAGFEYVDAQGKVVIAKYFPTGTTAPAGTEIKVLVHTNPDQLFAIKSDEALDQGDIGGIFTLTNIGAGSISTGRSTATLDGSSIPLSEAAATVRVVGLEGGPENEIGDIDAVVIVEFVNPGIGATV